jgi:hypothetical protein
MEVTFIKTHAQEAVFEATALEVGLEFSVDMVGQGFALLGQLLHQGREVRFDELVEKCLLGLMPFVGSIAGATPDNAGWALPINRGRPSLPCANMLVPPREIERTSL